MSDLSNIRFDILSASAIEQFSHLIAPGYKEALNLVDGEDTSVAGRRVIAIGASNLWIPVGLIVFVYSEDAKESSAQVLSLAVDPLYQRVGIGTALLKQAEAYLVQEGVASVIIKYTSPEAVEPSISLERVLQKCAWSALKPTMRIYKTDIRAQDMPWLNLDLDLPPDVEIISYEALDHQQKEALRASVSKTDSIPAYLSPFRAEELIEPLNSLWLLYKQEICGWIMTHRLTPTLLRYSNIYVAPEPPFLRTLGLGMVMFADSVKRHLKYGSHILEAIYFIGEENTAMLRLVNKYLRPYASAVLQTRVAQKNLKGILG